MSFAAKILQGGTGVAFTAQARAPLPTELPCKTTLLSKGVVYVSIMLPQLVRRNRCERAAGGHKGTHLHVR